MPQRVGALHATPLRCGVPRPNINKNEYQSTKTPPPINPFTKLRLHPSGRVFHHDLRPYARPRIHPNMHPNKKTLRRVHWARLSVRSNRRSPIASIKCAPRLLPRCGNAIIMSTSFATMMLSSVFVITSWRILYGGQRMRITLYGTIKFGTNGSEVWAEGER